MAVHIRAQIRWPHSTGLPKDVMEINPCFRNTLALPGWDSQGLAQDLANAIAGWQRLSYDPVEVRLYDIEGSKPVYPMATAWANKGATADVGDQPREVAVCLSFYADQNVPRRRGRLYIPHVKLYPKTNLDLKVNSGAMGKAMALGPILAGLGGADIDWIVWSHADHAAHKVTNYWCDNEWDTVRSRGLKADQRQLATTSG